MTLGPPVPPVASDCASAASPGRRALRANEFEALVRRHRTEALRVARKHLHNPSSADDVVQQAFLVIFKDLPRYEERGAFEGYLRTVLRNLCRMDNRALGARTRLLARARVEAPAAAADRESTLALRRAVSSLSEPLREVIVLRYCLGLSHGEIAERVAAPVGTVRRRNFDALRRLHALLECNDRRRNASGQGQAPDENCGAERSLGLENGAHQPMPAIALPRAMRSLAQDGDHCR